MTWMTCFFGGREEGSNYRRLQNPYPEIHKDTASLKFMPGRRANWAPFPSFGSPPKTFIESLIIYVFLWHSSNHWWSFSIVCPSLQDAIFWLSWSSDINCRISSPSMSLFSLYMVDSTRTLQDPQKNWVQCCVLCPVWAGEEEVRSFVSSFWTPPHWKFVGRTPSFPEIFTSTEYFWRGGASVFGRLRASTSVGSWRRDNVSSCWKNGQFNYIKRVLKVNSLLDSSPVSVVRNASFEVSCDWGLRTVMMMTRCWWSANPMVPWSRHNLLRSLLVYSAWSMQKIARFSKPSVH